MTPTIPPAPPSAQVTPYFASLPRSVQERVRSNGLYEGIRAATANSRKGMDDILMSLAVKESGGRMELIGDKHLKRPAIGGFQIRYGEEWAPGADLFDPHQTAAALLPKINQLYDECGGDVACVHFKYNAGPRQPYTPENVARVSKRFPHVDARLKSIQASFAQPAPAQAAAPVQAQGHPMGMQGTAPMPMPPPAPTQALGMGLPSGLDNMVNASWTLPDPSSQPSLLSQLGPLLRGTGADQGGGVKSKKPTTSLFGL